MGNIASINFKPTNNIQLKHNDRTTPPTYLLAKELGYGCECNRNCDDALALRDELVAKAKERYKQAFNQPFKSTRNLWSAVVNIKPTTTMQDLERLARHFKKEYGFQCYQIAIHRDEGHIDEEGNVVINHHAHMEFVMLDEHTGKNVFRTIRPRHLRQIQSEVATILGMQRGVDNRKSGVKRIEPRAYAKLMEKNKVERKELKDKYQSEKDKKNRNHQIIQRTYDGLIDLLKLNDDDLIKNESLKGLSYIEKMDARTKADLEIIVDRINALKQEKLEVEKALAELIDNAPKGKKTHTLIEGARKIWAKLNKGLKEVNLSEFEAADYKALRELKKEGLSIESLKARITELENLAEARLQEKIELTEAKDKLSAELKNLQTDHGVTLANMNLLKFDKQILEKRVNDFAEEKYNLSRGYKKELEGIENEYKDTIQGLQTINSKLSKRITELEKRKPKEVYISPTTPPLTL
ncbi:hypothetical protein [Helicobacter sp. NHP22-001]|uniref:hypothetical protein n=1 Tax=Helicobacter sp. NHP22-001 TaxID=3040202 RepID=UPI00244D8441|nr:hypothetical protein [Helicobacter sp. NHP22-001]GMB96778.1 hypothetical protein NHP22001_13670 [Helicobacter sp. NHP22-001]